jgi:hypothetical protein
MHSSTQRVSTKHWKNKPFTHPAATAGGDCCVCCALHSNLFCNASSCSGLALSIAACAHACAADGEHLGSLSESGTQESIINPFAVGPYGSPYTQQLQAPASADPAGDINPKQGLEPALLDSLFQRPSAELVSEVSGGQRGSVVSGVPCPLGFPSAVQCGSACNGEHGPLQR